MEECLDFKFEIILQRLCFIKIAKTFWEKEETRKEVVHFFQKRYNRYDEEETNSVRWNKLTNQVLIPLKDLSLPGKLKRQLKYVTNSLGLQIFNWTKYVTKILKFDISCARDIFWSHYGTIDKNKIFKVWVEKRNLESSQLFNIACIFCLEEYISTLWNEIPEEVKKNDFYTETIYTMPKYHLIAYWKNFLTGGLQGDFIFSMATTERVRIERMRIEGHFTDGVFDERRIAWFHIFADNNNIDENMFRVSVLEGLELAVKYFWNKLKDQQRRRNVQFSMHTAKRKSEEPEYAEILIFIMSKLSIKENVGLCYDELFILEMLLKNWPWEEFFMTVLDRILQFYQDPLIRDIYNYETKFFNLICIIVEMMKIDFILYDSIEEGRYQAILHEIWTKIPESIKVLVSGKRNWLIFSELLNIEDFKSLGLIINYEGFRGEKFSKRTAMILCMKSLFINLMSDRKIDLMERFVNEVGLDENEKIKLREELRYC